MEIKRNINRLTNWKALKNWAKYHDLDLFRISKSSRIVVITILIIDAIQRLSLISINFPLDSKLNRIHREFYSSVTEIVSLKTSIRSHKVIFTISIGAYMLLKLIATSYFFYIAQSVEVLRSKAAQSLRFFEFLKFVDITILLIPLTGDCFENIFAGEMWELSMVSLGSLITLIVEFFYMNTFSIDLRFFKQNLYQGRDKFMEFLRFFGLIFLTFLKNLNEVKLKSEDFDTFINFLNFVLGLWLIYDFSKKLHFMQLQTIRYSYVILNLLYMVESLSSVILFFYPNFIKIFDMDYMIIAVFMLVISYTLVVAKNKEHRLENKFVFDIKKSIEADQYMENLACLFKNTNSKGNKLRLFSLLKLHFKKCKDLRCLCFLLKYPLKKTKEKRLVDHLVKSQNRKKHLKFILYDDIVAMQILRKEYKSRRNEDNDKWENMTENEREDSDFGETEGNSEYEHREGFYLVNLNSKDLPTVFASFYHIMVSNFEKENPFLFFCSYLSFLVFEVNNYVGTLINAYNYMFRLGYRVSGGILKNIKLMNFIDISNIKLHRKFLESPYWISNKCLFKVFNFTKRVDELEQKFIELIKLNVHFYQELGLSSINFRLVVESGKKIYKIKNEMEKEFESLFKISNNNSKLITLYLNFKLNINFDQDEALIEHYQKLHSLYQMDGYKTFQELANKHNNLNLFSNTNMLVFVNILKSKFYISKFTSNTPPFFEMDEKDLKGKHLNDLMPSEISKDHDRYVLDFVNQKKTPIIKTASLTSFAVTKSGAIKLVSVIVKVEYLINDDIYLCGIIVPHPKNKEVLILSNLSGRIIGMNKKAKKLLGTMIIDNPYSLFVSIPLLVKYFYPEIEKQLRYSKFSSRQDRRNVVMEEEDKEFGMNFELETEEFSAFFFKYILSDKAKLKGMFQESKNGILSNFGFQDLKYWNILRDISSKMLMPKHIRILSRVIAKNRELMINNSDEILTTYITVDTYKNRGNLTLKLIGLHKISATNDKVKKFFIHASKKLKGEMADVFMVAPKDINNLCKYYLFSNFFSNFMEKILIFLILDKILKVERLIKMSTWSDSKRSFLAENSKLESSSGDIIKNLVKKESKNTDPISEPKHKSYDKKLKKVKTHNPKTNELNFPDPEEIILPEEDLLSRIADDYHGVNPEEYYFDKNFIVSDGEVFQSKEHTDQILNSFKKPKNSLGPRGSTLNRSGHRKVSFMSKKNTVPEPVEPIKLISEGSYEKMKNIYGTKNLDEYNKKNSVPKIQVNRPSGSISNQEQASDEMVDHSEDEEYEVPLDNPDKKKKPNFRYVTRQKSVESRLKYLSDIYTELIKTSQVNEALKSICTVMDIEKLREIEASGHTLGELKDTEEQMRDFVIKVETSEEASESQKNIALDMVTYTADNMKRSSIASYQSKIIARVAMEKSIKNVMENIFSRSLILVKLMVFFFLILFTALIRMAVNSTIKSNISVILGLYGLSQTVTPAGYLYKDLMKLELYNGGFLDVSVIEKNYFFCEIVLGEMNSLLVNHFEYLSQNNINGITTNNYRIKKNDFIEEKIQEDLSFFTLYIHMIKDYNHLETEIKEKNFKIENFRFDLESSRFNLFELISKMTSNFDSILNYPDTLQNDYSRYYLIFLFSNTILTICIGFLLVVLNLRANRKIEQMTNLLLRIEKEKIQFYYEKFSRVQTSIKFITKKKIKPSDRIKIKKTLKMGKKKNSMGKSRRQNFSTFVSKEKSNSFLLSILIILTMIFVNIPMGIDYILVSQIVKQATILNSISLKSNLMSGELYSYYGLFYEQMLKKHRGIEPEAEILKLDDKLLMLYDRRDELQNLISGYQEFDKVQSLSICDYALEEIGVFREKCQNVINNQKNYNLFLALSDLQNFKITSLATVKGKSESPVINTLDFLRYDRSLYFISKNLEKMMKVSNEMVNSTLDSERLVSFFFFFMFVCFMAIYYLVFKKVLIRKKTLIVNKLGYCYLCLPPQVIGSNSYLINFFKLKK